MRAFRTAFLSGLVLLLYFSSPIPAIATKPIQNLKKVIYLSDGSERARLAFVKLEGMLDALAVKKGWALSLENRIVAGIAMPKGQNLLEHEHGPDAILALSQDLAEWSKASFPSSNIVFATQADPVKTGLVEGFVKPGGRLTGISFHTNSDYKALELLVSSFSSVRRIGVLADARWRQLTGDSLSLEGEKYLGPGRTAHFFPVETSRGVLEAVNSNQGRSMDAWYVPNTNAPFSDPQGVVAAINSTAKPAVYSRTKAVAVGGLVAYQVDLPNPYQLVVEQLELVLSGIPPAEIPIIRPRHFEISINLRTARESKIRIDKGLLTQANVIFP